jgi:hypothetical protein
MRKTREMSGGLEPRKVPDFGSSGPYVDDKQVNADRQAPDSQLASLFRATERPRRTVEVADLRAVDSLLRCSERKTSRRTDLDTHELCARPGIDCDDVDLVALRYRHVSRDDLPAALDQPLRRNVLGQQSAALAQCPHGATLSAAGYRGLIASQ